MQYENLIFPSRDTLETQLQKTARCFVETFTDLTISYDVDKIISDNHLFNLNDPFQVDYYNFCIDQHQRDGLLIL